MGTCCWRVNALISFVLVLPAVNIESVSSQLTLDVDDDFGGGDRHPQCSNDRFWIGLLEDIDRNIGVLQANLNREIQWRDDKYRRCESGGGRALESCRWSQSRGFPKLLSGM